MLTSRNLPRVFTRLISTGQAQQASWQELVRQANTIKAESQESIAANKAQKWQEMVKRASSIHSGKITEAKVTFRDRS